MTVRLQVKRRRGSFGLPLVVLACGLGWVQWMIFGEMIDRTVGFASLSEPDSFALALEKPSVALLRSRASAQLLPTQADYYYELSRQWEVVLRDAGIRYTVINDAELAAGVANSHSALVLPSARCLGEEQKSRIAAFLAAGKGIVASGGLGVRDAECKWTGYDYLSRTTGIKSFYPVPASQMEYATFRGQRYFSGSISAGYALPLPDQELIAGHYNEPDIYWSDDRLRPATGQPMEKNTLAVHGYRDRGRFVWFGFSETQPASKSTTRQKLDQFLVSAVRWAARQPLAAVADWPANRNSAVMISETMSDDPNSAHAAAALFLRTGTPVTFFVPGSLTTSHPQAVQALARAGEVATAGDSDEPFVEQSATRQAERLNRVMNSLTALQIRPAGFNPPSDLADQATTDALLRARFAYYVSSAAPAAGLPEIHEQASKGWLNFEKAAVTRIDRPWSDDFEVIANYRGPKTWGKDLGNGFLREFETATKLGGLYTFSFHAGLLGAREHLPIVENVIETMRNGKTWVASGKQVSEWWMNRNQLRVGIRMVNRHRIRLAVTNRGENQIEGANVVVQLPYRSGSVRLIPAVHALHLPRYKMLSGQEAMQLEFPAIPGRSSHIYLVSLNE